MKTIVTLTMNPALNMFLEVPRVVAGRKLRCETPVYGAGGGGISVSRAIRRLGGTSTAIFPAGGATGDLLIDLLRRETIPVNAVHVTEPTRQDVSVLERATGNDFRFFVPGPDLAANEWEQCLRAVRSLDPVPDIVVASGTLPPCVPVDFYGRVAAIARDIGFKLIVDTSGEPLRYAAAEGTYLLKPNVAEVALITGGAISQTIIEAAARAIVATFRAHAVVISAGPAGAMLVDGRGLRRIAAPVVPVASKAGAGDSMVAGIAVALARGWDLDNAVEFGVAAGSAAVMATGHQLCRREDAEMLFERMRGDSPAVPDANLTAAVTL
ncbi:MAG TPA: 1-phosphofructokinase family hexose kinase [Thermoanaerobaculia bacterium]